MGHKDLRGGSGESWHNVAARNPALWEQSMFEFLQYPPWYCHYGVGIATIADVQPHGFRLVWARLWLGYAALAAARGCRAQP